MATYLLSWNPEKWHWNNLNNCINELKSKGYYIDSWSTGVTKKIHPNDRVFLIKLGRLEPKGIMASGKAESEVYEGTHWNNEERKKGKKALYIDVRFDTILNPEKNIFPYKNLSIDVCSEMSWSPVASGITIPDNVAKKLEVNWKGYLNSQKLTRKLSVIRKQPSKGQTITRKAGGGFGTPENNKKVEKAAVLFVKKHFKSQGWSVHSVENKKCGYDLFCIKGSIKKHIEVKGVKGNIASFIITAGEVEKAKKDIRYILCVVTSAISKTPQLSKYSPKDFIKKFELYPISYLASPRV